MLFTWVIFLHDFLYTKNFLYAYLLVRFFVNASIIFFSFYIVILVHNINNPN